MVLHEETVFLHGEAARRKTISPRGGNQDFHAEATNISMRRQPRYPRGGSQDFHDEAVSSPQGVSTVKSSTMRHLSYPSGGK